MMCVYVCVCVRARARVRTYVRLLLVWSENKFTVPILLVLYCHLQLEQLTFNCTDVLRLILVVVSQLPIARTVCVAANRLLQPCRNMIITRLRIIQV
jgi:hypothetical protein